MTKIILLVLIFSLSAYGQRVKENIKVQSNEGLEKPTGPVKAVKKPAKSIRK